MLKDDVVFVVDGEPYRWRDVLLAAGRWGDWSAIERRARAGWASVAHAGEKGNPFPADEVEAAGREFRYDRDLLTALSMEEWLDRWDISVREWTAFLHRDLHLSRSAAISDDIVARHPLPADEISRISLIEAICTGALDQWKRKLASRAALPTNPVASSSRHIGGRPDIPVAVLAAFEANPDDVSASLMRLERLDQAFNDFRAAHLTDRALQDHIGARQLDWMRFDCRVMAFPDESMAAEAALLLTEDDEGFTGVYSAAHAEPRAAKFFLEEMDASARDRFVGARAGDLVGPLQLNGEFALYLVLEKVLPTPRDPLVRARAEEGVLKGLLDRQVTNRVRWQRTGQQ